MDVVPKIFPILNVIGHLPVAAGWGSYLLKLAIFVNFNWAYTEKSASLHHAHKSTSHLDLFFMNFYPVRIEGACDVCNVLITSLQ